ncbi:hypothetical protein FACS1894177_04660 [Bacteroidia bacterium]|nr:hypothetical protein FACS1894177_04660 [Bacteroidia bacterium]
MYGIVYVFLPDIQYGNFSSCLSQTLGYATSENSSGARYTTFEGYSAVKDFFGNQTNLEDTLLDGSEHQRTLYWNPNVKTDEAGKASVRFFNTGSGQKIDISAEGLTKNGIAVIKK